jgi:asparagine synthase (glutamine-hydrolysing)
MFPAGVPWRGGLCSEGALMCGIAALFSRAPAPLADLVSAMATLVRYRGPDDEGLAIFSGVELEPHAWGGPDTPLDTYQAAGAYAPARAPAEGREALAALAHRRLSIVDLSPAGHQPMCTPDRRYWIVYNGEVYNHVELRAELEALGHRFQSHSDTEVILYAYREWGEHCLERFNGMFAFVLLDRVARRVLVARDRFGVKPLYLWHSPDGTVALASEIKQFSTLPGWAPRVHSQRAYEFLQWGLLDHSQETLFAGVRQLRGGESIHCTLEDLCDDPPVRRWYRLAVRAFDGTFDDAAREFRERFADAVRIRLRADVPVGSCLSGGLDSSSIVCTANLLLRATNAQAGQKTFSAGARVKRFDERDFIESVVAHTGVEAHYTYPELADLFATVDAITWHQDEPFHSTSIYAQWEVFRLAAEARVKVLLDGQGADELLAGYHGFFAPHFASLFRSLRWGLLWRELRAAKRVHGIGLWAASKYLGSGALPGSIARPLRRLVGKGAAAPDWIDVRRIAIDDRDPDLAYGLKATTVNGMAHSLMTATGLPMLLHWEDRDSMAHSVESRLPFLDFRLVEFVMGLPAEFKLVNGTTKQVLRAAMRGTLPEKVRNRMDKMGFVTPEEIWVREGAPDLFRRELERAIEASRGILTAKALDRLEAVIAGREPFGFLVWRMISFGRWMERFGMRLAS